MRSVLNEHKPDRPLHVQVYSEFSGAGTAEISAKALAAAAPESLEIDVVSVADWDNIASSALMANSSSNTHVFGDIASACSEKMQRLCERPVGVKVRVQGPTQET